MLLFLKLTSAVEESVSCRDGSRGDVCDGPTVRIRTTKTKVEPAMRCYERELPDLCAPLNCRFHEKGTECMETVKVVNVSVTVVKHHLQAHFKLV